MSEPKSDEPPSSATRRDSRARVLGETFVAYAAVAAVVAILARLVFIPFVVGNLHALVGVAFVIAALVGAKRAGGPTRRFGFALGGLLADVRDDDPDREPGGDGITGLFRDLYRALPDAGREILAALAVAAVVLPPFALGFYLWRRPDHPFVFSWGERPVESIAAQLLVVGLPEEAFFRGYVQTRLTDTYPATIRIRGIELSAPALVLQAAMFGAVHIVSDFDPGRLATFFPGLLFGAVRSWRGGVGACIVLHALCNLFASTLSRGWS